MTQIEKNTYRLRGLSCRDCSDKFLRNVAALPDVKEASINFGAAKLTVIGRASLSELEAAGAFDHIKVLAEDALEITEHERKAAKLAFLKDNKSQLIAVAFIIMAYVSRFALGKESWLTIACFLIAMVIGGYGLFIEGVKDLVKLNFTMSTLMTIAVIGATCIGDYAEGAIVVVLFAINEMLEGYASDRARQSISSLVNLAPKTATIRRPGGDVTLDVTAIQIGDIMRIKPGQKIAMDGIVVHGRSTVNQAAITGESVPVLKNLSDVVFAGSLNETGYLEVEVTKHVKDTTLSKIIQLVEEAQEQRAPAQAFVDKFAKVYTPFIIFLACLIVIVPPLCIDGDWQRWLYQGLSILVVGCPCSLVLSTPVAIVSAIGNAARHGVLVKGGIYLEEIGKLQAIAFDKTGTLTVGKPSVTDFILLDEADDELDSLQKLAALESYSQHPLAGSIVDEVAKRYLSISQIQIENFEAITGRGVKGDIAGTTYIAGSLKLFEKDYQLTDLYQGFHEQGKTVIFFGTSDRLIALIACQDVIRETSQQMITDIQALGLKATVMLTGDNQVTAAAIGHALGLTAVKADLMPEDKLQAIRDLEAKLGPVAMVGDGVNDAPALAAAHVGIVMGMGGTDTALETADVTLMGDDLAKLPFIIRLSRKTLNTIKQNITFSLGLKLLAISLVIPGWLTLWIAILADMGATILVTLNGIRLMRIRP